MGLTAALAVLLSVLPLPDALRPLPDLRELPLTEAVLSYVWPKALKPTESQDLALPSEGELALEAESSAAEDATKASGAPPAHEGALTLQDVLAALPVHERNEARQLEATARRIGAKPVDILEGCRQSALARCNEWALDPFFKALEAVAQRKRSTPVRVVHLGDSLIASDHISDMIRRRLEARHGSGGKGFLFIDRPTRGSGRKVRTGEATEGWDIFKLTDRTPPRDRLGYSGVSFVPKDPVQRASFAVGPERYAELFYLAKPRGGAVGVRANGELVAEIRTELPRTEVSYARVELPEGTKSVEIAPFEGEVELFGLSLETGASGIILDSIGLPGATAEVFLRTDEHAFATQLQRAGPELVLIMLGGNEAHELGKGWTNLEQVRAHTRDLLTRIRRAVPGAACLVTSPMDAGVPTVGRKINVRQGSREIGDIQRALALEQGCAFWDMLEAVGGQGAIHQWVKADLMLSDLVHPRGKGADVVGHLFDLSLERARLLRTKPSGPARSPSVRPPEAPAAPETPPVAPSSPSEQGARPRSRAAPTGRRAEASA